MPVEAARHELALPERRLVVALVRPPLALDAGRIVSGPADRAVLPAPVVRAVERLGAELSARPSWRRRRAGWPSWGWGPASWRPPSGRGRCSGWPTGSCCCPARTSWPAGCSPGCRSRSRSARPGGPSAPAAGSRCRSWNTSTAGAHRAGRRDPPPLPASRRIAIPGIAPVAGPGGLRSSGPTPTKSQWAVSTEFLVGREGRAGMATSQANCWVRLITTASGSISHPEAAAHGR